MESIRTLVRSKPIKVKGRVKDDDTFMVGHNSIEYTITKQDDNTATGERIKINQAWTKSRKEYSGYF
jgi:hypothetical protein